MSVLIKDMKMPKYCGECELDYLMRNKHGGVIAAICFPLCRDITSTYWSCKQIDCPLVELPETCITCKHYTRNDRDYCIQCKDSDRWEIMEK